MSDFKPMIEAARIAADEKVTKGIEAVVDMLKNNHYGSPKPFYQRLLAQARRFSNEQDAVLAVRQAIAAGVMKAKPGKNDDLDFAEFITLIEPNDVYDIVSVELSELAKIRLAKRGHHPPSKTEIEAVIDLLATPVQKGKKETFLDRLNEHADPRRTYTDPAREKIAYHQTRAVIRAFLEDAGFDALNGSQPMEPADIYVALVKKVQALRTPPHQR